VLYCDERNWIGPFNLAHPVKPVAPSYTVQYNWELED